jgi:hypothetical protein
MPLSINVGLSRKASRDYQSTGVSINVTAELDATLLTKPDELQHQIDGLYAQARGAIDRQVRSPEPRGTNGDNRDQAPRRYQRSDHGRSNGNGNGHGNRTNGNGNNGASLMTTSQRRAILSIAERANANIDVECREIIGTPFDALSVREASQLIDHLKAIVPADRNR